MQRRTITMADRYYLKPPSQQKFYNVMAFLLSILALNNNFWAFYKMPNHILCRIQKVVSQYSMYAGLFSQTLYLVMNYSQHDFNTLAMMYTIVPVTCVMVVKVVVAQTPGYKKAMIEFMDQIHIYRYYCNNEQPHVEEILIKAEKYTRWSIYILSMLCAVCGTSFLVVPMVHNFQNTDSIYNITTRLETVVHFWMPFDYEFNFFNWVIMQVALLYCLLLSITINVMFDITNIAFLYHLTGHIKILKHNIKEEFKEKMTQEETKSRLVGVTRYYSFIVRIFKKFQEAFGVNIVAIYLHNLFGGGLLMYQIMTSGTNTGTLLSYGLMIPIYMGELVIMSFVMEEIRIQADEIPELVYNLHWENMSIPNQKLLLVILCQVQPVLEIKAAFNAKTGLNPAINIIKTAFSYYVMIKSRM